MVEVEQMLVLAKRQDTTAFAGLVRTHQAMVFSAALHFFRNATWAEEIAQEVFLDLYRSIRSIQSAEHLRAWLRRSTMCRCIDLSRKRNHRAEVPLDDLVTSTAMPGARDVFAADWVRDEVARLSESHRAVLILRYQEELEPAEIAGLLDLPVNTVKSRLHRALETLRSRFQQATARSARQAV